MTKQIIKTLTPNIMYNLLCSELKVDEEYFEDSTEGDSSLIPRLYKTEERTFHFHTKTKNGFTCTIYVITPPALTIPSYYLFPETEKTREERQNLRNQLHFGYSDNLQPTVGDFKILDKHPTLIAYYCITPYINLTLEDLQTIFDSKLNAIAEKELAGILHSRRTEDILNSCVAPVAVSSTSTENSDFAITTTISTQWEPIHIESASRINWANLNQALSNNEDT